jgi:hypothetical protein
MGFNLAFKVLNENYYELGLFLKEKSDDMYIINWRGIWLKR